MNVKVADSCPISEATYNNIIATTIVFRAADLEITRCPLAGVDIMLEMTPTLARSYLTMSQVIPPSKLTSRACLSCSSCEDVNCAIPQCVHTPGAASVLN